MPTPKGETAAIRHTTCRLTSDGTLPLVCASWHDTCCSVCGVTAAICVPFDTVGVTYWYDWGILGTNVARLVDVGQHDVRPAILSLPRSPRHQDHGYCSCR
jgi:hypothetical protein